MLADSLLIPLAIVGTVLILSLPVLPAGKVLLFIVVGRSLTEFGAGSELSTASAALSAALGLLAIIAAFMPRGTRIPHRLHLPIALILLVLILGSVIRLVGGEPPLGAFREAITLGSILAVFVLAYSFAAQHLDKALKYLLWCSFPAAVISTVGFFGGVPAMAASGDRMNGTFNHANTAGAFLAISALLALCLALNLRRPRLLWIGAVSVAGLIVTQSIGAWIGVIAALAVFVIATSALSGLQKGLLMIASSVGALAAVTFLGLPDRFNDFINFNFQAALDQGVTTNSLDWRLLNWHLLIEAWQEKPWFGYGLGASSTTLMPLEAPAHSLPIQLLVETGIVGCSLVAVTFAIVIFWVLGVLKEGRWEAALLLALATFVLVNGSESNLLGYTPAMYLIALACGVLCASIRYSRPRHLATTPEKVWRRPWGVDKPLAAHSSQRSVPSIHLITDLPPLRVTQQGQD
ncbi:O-antigen ligase family protein [Arthrobacter sp. TB 23]|uniref:O-antigen ligase family protein n=1 Tax=Arthrobacter sp. TB 23 TaxID=494419 RepID=UPI0002F622F7|nr:O-antigen ligase family protein [Arthrobacter sp. TB 23]